MKNNRRTWIASTLLILPFMGFAQQTDPLTNSKRLFEDGKELFLRHDYAAAQQTLTRYLRKNPQTEWNDEVSYMLACAAYELNEPDKKAQLQRYIKTYPESRHITRAYSLLGTAYYEEEDYTKAIECYLKARVETLPDTERDDSMLRLGISYLKIGDLREAYVWLNILKSLSTTHRNDAVYQLAYISYVEKKNDKALQGFGAVLHDEKYAPLAPYYIADIYLTNKNYAQAEQTAADYLSRYATNEKATEMKRIRGEALYGLERYADAIPLLESYQTKTGASAERNALYKLGMSYYNTGVYSKAAEALSESESEQEQDAMTQNAYLHQGLAYLQLKDRTRARMAFEQASAMNADNAIREQALYNYALCLHETAYSPFAESVTVFERFLNEFPQSAYADKVNDYLVEVYMNSRNYETALRSIDKISRPGTRLLEAKQKLLFRMGTQSVAQAQFDTAIDYFTRSLQLGQYDRQTKADAYYWRGESKYRKEQYAEAASDFRQYLANASGYEQTTEYGLALYNLGYTSFKRKQYDDALRWFTQCVEQSTSQDRAVMADAYNRMGDCLFYARRFDEARTYYGKASATDSSLGDYSLFQEGFVKGLQRDYKGKIETLNRLLTDYPSSQYIDDALYEQGRAFVQMEDNRNAIDRYSLLTRNYPDSPLSKKAANEIGLLYYQDDNYSEAIAAYKKVISSYPGSEEARLAQRDLRSIYVDLNRVDEYMDFVSTASGTTLDVTERDSLTYAAAERVYLKGNTTEAKNSFERYLQSFPKGAYCIDAHYYLGLMDYSANSYESADGHLEKVLEFPSSKYASEAMAMSADIAYRTKAYEKAARLYKRMADQTGTAEERQTALTGALRSAWMTGDLNETASTASALLAQSKLTPELMNEAYYYRAKVLLKENKWNDAAADLRVLAKDTRHVYGAEAKYLLAQLYFDLGETEKAEKEVLDYIEVSTPHAYWLARSFVLLSDVYVKMGRTLDAKQYLLSLKQNYQEKDDIAGMIESRLAKLKK